MESLVEVEDFPGRLLHVAALWDNGELLTDLLHGEERSCLDARDSLGRTALHAAATNPASRCLAILLAAGAEVDALCGVKGEGRTPLHVAAEHGHAHNARILAQAGANLLLRDQMGLTALDLAEKGHHEKCVQVLREMAHAQEEERLALLQTLRSSCVAGDLAALRAVIDPLDAPTVSALVNHASSGSNTLLFKASEYGHRDLVQYLIERGADGRSHPVTKYTPLYIAAYNGHKDVVELLLRRFPKLIQVLTVEQWSPLHAACINGHSSIFEILLKYPFRSELLRTFRDKTGQWSYDLAFDVNQCDVTGQSVLYLACCIGNQKIVDTLLSMRVRARKVTASDGNASSSSAPPVSQSQDDMSLESLQKKAKVTGIQALISKLRGGGSQNDDSLLAEDEKWWNPVDLDLYCNNGQETALHHAVKRREHTIVSRMLRAGANPNLVIYANEGDLTSMTSFTFDEQFYFRGSTALVEACKNRDMGMIDLLLKYSARDDDNKALYIALQHKDDVIVSKLLSLKANHDVENEINKKGITDFNHSHHSFAKGLASSLAYSSIFPSTSVMINWHNQGGYLHTISEQYIIDATMRLNPKLKLSPKFQFSAIHAVTRLDLSNNQLTDIPDCIWSMQSLKFLNLAQNKLDTLPSNVHRKIGLSALRSARSSLYSCPWLEEIQLQDNRLETLPAAMFSLPSLMCLDVSNNKLQFLPYELWSASKLKELNLSFNLLSELPGTRFPLKEDDDNNSPTCSTSHQAKDSSSISDLSLAETDSDIDEMNPNLSGEYQSNTDDDSSSSKQSNAEKRKCLEKSEVRHLNLWSGCVDVVDRVSSDIKDTNEESSCLMSLNLAHNSFTVVPRCLSCLCPSLARLNLAFNSLSKSGAISNYPQSIKHLDLSNNLINDWLGETSRLAFNDNYCYSLVEQPQVDEDPNPNKKFSRMMQRQSVAKINACVHKKHPRLENLRTLILSGNALTYINIYSRGDLDTSGSQNSEDNAGISEPTPGDRNIVMSNLKSYRIVFPALSMLDVSNNEIHSIPSTLNDLVNLSVLNISGNTKITELPPQMGLLNKLWNLNTTGCSLQEPLLTMTSSKAYKTSDIIGYLRSVLENSKPYARIKLMVVGIQGIGKTTLLEQLRQESGSSFRRKPMEHWAKRMGNKNINMKTGKGVSISTVGVDIGDWTFEKRAERGQPSFGPVVFRTWDFGGQTEYYATHQYFLSKRSLYLVVWKITDGERGVNEIMQWLINIQARAPNSPVIIVGTHYDVVKDEFPPSFSEYLQQKIRGRFINISDPEKCGLPRVLDSIEISCKTKFNVRILANLLYETAFNLKSPGSKTRLLEQKIPATYLALEDLIAALSSELKAQGSDPVLNQEQFEETINLELEKRFHLKFRDNTELNQATKFLHENGLLLHYDDATLRDLYFLDPQWLCDILSHVVTIREINPFAKNGVMRLEDLRHVFKSSASISVTAKSYIVNLLNKFEVALTWDSRTLLIPSLLPTEQQMRSGLPGMDLRVKIAVRSRGWGFRGRRAGHQIASTSSGTTSGHDKSYNRSRSVPARQLLKGGKLKISGPVVEGKDKTKENSNDYEMTRRSEAEHAIHRLCLMSYFPSGFWSRLLTRILADDTVVEIVRSYFIIPEEINQDPVLTKIFVDQKPEWVCWQTGIELRYMETTLFSLKQVQHKIQGQHDYSNYEMVIYLEECWNPVDSQQSSIMEVILPQDTVVIKRTVLPTNQGESIGYQAIVLDPNPKSVCQLLALAVEHIDTLLEDWYPSLGTRFLHTSEGKMLVTRLIPCPRCLAEGKARNSVVSNNQSWQDWSFLPDKLQRDAQIRHQSRESATSDKDSGVGQESPRGSRKSTTDSVCVEAKEQDEGGGEQVGSGSSSTDDKIYSFLVEQTILEAFEGTNPHCPKHGDLVLGQIAPDTVFLDLDERLRISNENIKQGDLIGRGAFGFVYESVCKLRGSNVHRNVAVKMLQPIDPGPNARESTEAAFKMNRSKWERDPLQYACKAYCSARQELNILIHLKHAHIVPLIGICSNPLSIVLELAPQGALDQKLAQYRRFGDKFSAKSIQLIILQVARALEYLHQHHIIYRDLKSENVLVWQLPEPFSKSPNQDVHMKLADYGISRPTLPTGTKGFGGTEGFMAPEIVKYNGEEEYTEKVDTFSFGMFIYELLTLQQPFTGFESVKELILEGGRPPITYKELAYPTYFIDLMVMCWSQQPRDRPTASQLVSISSAPEFLHLIDVVALNYGLCCAHAIVPSFSTKQNTELWMTCSSAFDERPQLHVLEVNPLGWQDHLILKTNLTHNVTSMCLVNNSAVWFGDNLGFIHAYSTTQYSRIFSYKMEPDELEDAAPVRSIHYLPDIQRVCVAMHNGRMFLCCANVIPRAEEGCEGTFLITELGSATCIHCVTSINRGKSVEIWCGESHGALSVFTLKDGIVTSQEVINHHDPVIENIEVLHVISQEYKGSSNESLIWTSIYPGSVIYQWQTGDKRGIKNRLDCSKLVPSSESLKTIAIDEHFSPGRCQIASMAILENKLYIGTSWGCLVVVDAVSMRPLSVFRPFSEGIQAIIPIIPPTPKASRQPLMVTLGKGYRSLIGRFVPDRRLRLSSEEGELLVESDIMSTLLWKPDDWLCD